MMAVKRTMTVEQRAIAEWKNNPALQKEFNGDFHAYVIYLKNLDAGLAEGKTFNQIKEEAILEADGFLKE